MVGVCARTRFRDKELPISQIPSPIPKPGALKVLVVDDDPIVLAVVSEWLERAGYEVHSRARAMGTSQWVMEHRPDVVLLDVRMPGLSGKELAQLIGSNSHTRDVMVILHSALPGAELDAMVEEAGAIGGLRKTPNAKQFLSNFEYLVQKRRVPSR